VCGRYYSLFDKQQIAEHFHVRRTADNVGIIAPNYNAAGVCNSPQWMGEGGVVKI
jgi:hypothetical protein